MMPSNRGRFHTGMSNSSTSLWVSAIGWRSQAAAPGLFRLAGVQGVIRDCEAEREPEKPVSLASSSIQPS